MAPGQGSKFAVLASSDPDNENRASSKSSTGSKDKKNKQKSNKNKKQQQSTSNTTKPLSETNGNETTNFDLPNKKNSVKKQISNEQMNANLSTETKLLQTKNCSISDVDNQKSYDSSTFIQNLFLWSVSAIYMFAFISFYYQIRGLYGDNGVLPLRHYAASLSSKNQSITAEELYAQNGSWVWLISRFGFTLTTSLELITITGILVSFGQLLFKSLRIVPNYLLLYIAYLSLSKVGQTFLHFQWDALLLEVGALTVFVAFKGSLAPDSRLVLWPIKWLMFRFMFSNGVVKLTSRCPLWWSLRTLDVHFESQCIPTPLAWYAHHLPQNWLHLFTALTFVIELIGPFLFFVPLKSARIFSFVTQVLFQVSIILTGNFNFFNLLTIVLSFSLLESNNNTKPRSRIEIFLNGAFSGTLAYYTIQFFAINFDKGVSNIGDLILHGPNSKINFTFENFNHALSHAITISIWIGSISLIHISVRSIYICLSSEQSFMRRFLRLLTTLFSIGVCAAILALSVVPFAELDNSGQHLRKLPKPLKQWYVQAQENGLMHGYGLFRVMTGDGGRPELIIEGTNDPQNGPWEQYHFRYKPGDLKKAPRFNIPHQPRLDWQMWFAALGTYQANPWLTNFAYRLLTGEPDVLQLIDTQRLPFPENSPPKYLRMSRYLYKFTDNLNDIGWWKQIDNRHAYFPMVNKDTLSAALKLNEIVVPTWIQQLDAIEKEKYPILRLFLNQSYQTLVVKYSNLVEPQYLMVALFVFAFSYQWYLCRKNCQRCSTNSD